jgi:hypothetical protein
MTMLAEVAVIAAMQKRRELLEGLRRRLADARLRGAASRKALRLN